MIDIHSHVVYDIDDGPSDIEMSLDILNSAKLKGVNALFLTSHYMEDGYKASGDRYVERFNAIRDYINREDLQVEIYPGNEVMIYPDMAKDLYDGKFMTLNNSRYVLVELPLTEKVMYLENVLFEIVSKGYVPIIAHPERYVYFQDDVEYFKVLLSMGALLQINAGSIVGAYGSGAEKTAKYLLKNGMVQFIASDSHSPHRIFDCYPKITSKIKKIVGDENFNLLTVKNPNDVVNNVKINYECYRKPKRGRWLW